MAATEVFQDMQTTITAGLIGGVAGSISSRVGDYFSSALGVEDDGSVGNLAFRFALDALGSSIIYYAVAQIAPETTSNTYFAYTYFLANTPLTHNTIRLADRIVGFADASFEQEHQTQLARVRASGRSAVARARCTTC